MLSKVKGRWRGCPTPNSGRARQKGPSSQVAGINFYIDYMRLIEAIFLYNIIIIVIHIYYDDMKFECSRVPDQDLGLRRVLEV